MQWKDKNGRTQFGLVDALGRIILAGYTAAIQSLRIEEIDPLDQRYEPGRVSVTNGADATHDYFYDMAGFKRLDTTIILDCAGGTVTVKVWGSNQDDGTAPGSITDWADLGLDAFGVASLVAAAGAATDEWIDDACVLGGFKWIKYEVVANTGGPSGDWVLNTKKIW